MPIKAKSSNDDSITVDGGQNYYIKKMSKFLKFCPAVVLVFYCTGATTCQTAKKDYDARLAQCVEQSHQNPDDGIECLENLRRSDPDEKFGYLFLAGTYKRINQPDKANDAINAFLKAYPSNASGYETKCEILTDLDNFSDASTACAQAIKLEPREYSHQMAYAELKEKSGEPAEAEKICQGILSNEPKNPAALLYLGRLYEKAGKTDQAIETYEKLFQTDFELKDKLREGIKRLEEKRKRDANKENNSDKPGQTTPMLKFQKPSSTSQ